MVCAELTTAKTRLKYIPRSQEEEDEDEDGFEAQSLRDASMIGIARRPQTPVRGKRYAAASASLPAFLVQQQHQGRTPRMAIAWCTRRKACESHDHERDANV